ncbi:MAG: hypothetical protein GF398_19030 [Chitinivibrionales bacterium]|nr:hypothetical protein [Chitinivibrionales bacterium]
MSGSHNSSLQQTESESRFRSEKSACAERSADADLLIIGINQCLENARAYYEAKKAATGRRQKRLLLGMYQAKLDQAIEIQQYADGRCYEAKLQPHRKRIRGALSTKARLSSISSWDETVAFCRRLERDAARFFRALAVAENDIENLPALYYLIDKQAARITFCREQTESAGAALSAA